MVSKTFVVAPLPPPNVTLTRFHYNNGQLTFNWSSPTCPAVYYNINSTNCGECPHNTTSDSITCQSVLNSKSSNKCLLSVQSVVCDNLHGAFSQPVISSISIQG